MGGYKQSTEDLPGVKLLSRPHQWIVYALIQKYLYPLPFLIPSDINYYSVAIIISFFNLAKPCLFLNKFCGYITF